MLPSSTMKATRRSSFDIIEAERNKEDHVVDKIGAQKNFVNRATSPVRSAQNSNDELIQQTRRASSRHAELQTERSADTDFDREVRRFDVRRPTSFGNYRDGGDIDSRDYRGRSSDRQRFNERQTNYYRSEDRSQPGNVNDADDYLQDHDDHRHAAYNHQIGTDAMRRSKSLGRYNGNRPSRDRYGQDYCDNLHPSQYFPINNELLDRNSETEKQRSNYLLQIAYAREPKLREQGRFHREQSQRRRSQSLGRYEVARMTADHSGRYQFDEPQLGNFSSEMPRITGRFGHPSLERGNRYCEVRRYDEADGNKYFRKEMFLQGDRQFDLKRSTLDHSGFDRFGVDYFGYDRY